MQSNVPAELQEFSEQPFRQLAANQAAIDCPQHGYFLPSSPSD
jgi:hypothetical protein